MSASAAAPAAPRAPRRGSSLALGVLSALALTALGAVVHAQWAAGASGAAQAQMQQAQALVRALDLTDMAWFPEARYTRHPSQADLHSAFQDSPGALEHFPAGSLLAPTLPAASPQGQPSGFAASTPPGQ